MNKKIFNFKDNIIITMLLIFSFAFTITVATSFTFEYAYVPPNTTHFDKYKEKLNVTEEIRTHREYLSGAAGDSTQYFAIAMGIDEASFPPFTTRLLLPKLAGFIAKSSLFFQKIDFVNNDILFKRISLVNRFLNITFCSLLVLIPLFAFRKIFLIKMCPIAINFIPLVNVVNIGVVMTAPFFMIDVFQYLLFTIAAYFFFRKKIYKLFFLVCLSIFAKEISLILIIPLFYSVFKEKKINYYKKFLIIFFPLILYFVSRKIISGGVFELGMLRYNILRDPFDFFYLKYHLGSQWGIFNFIVRVLSSVGIIYLISFYMFLRFKFSKEKFLIISFMLFLVIMANLLLASGVLRVSQVITPFIIFYILNSYESISKMHKIKKFKSL
jgi:hypothetical protein